MTEPNDIENLIAIKQKRLAILEEQRARFGYNTPAEILMEIGDITAEIKKLEREREPIEYERFYMSAHIAKDGSASISREITLHALGKLTHLGHYLMVPLSRRPPDAATPLSVSVLRSPSPQRRLIYDAAGLEPANRVVSIRIEPPLHEGNRLEYALVERLRAGIALPGTAGRPGEFSQLGLDVNYPTKHLRIEVLLPVQWGTDQVEARVSRGGARITIPELTHQLHEGLSFGHTEHDGQLCSQHILEVDMPVRGLTYVLRWAPCVEDIGHR
jgi:hypothetical protein